MARSAATRATASRTSGRFATLGSSAEGASAPGDRAAREKPRIRMPPNVHPRRAPDTPEASNASIARVRTERLWRDSATRINEDALQEAGDAAGGGGRWGVWGGARGIARAAPTFPPS